jgi:FkbM family methyltransferase
MDEQVSLLKWGRYMKRLARRLLRRIALMALAYTGQFDITWRRLRRLRALGFHVDFAVDAGASDGTWTRGLKRIYPDAKVLCIEPREGPQQELRLLAARLPGIHVTADVLDATERSAVFHESHTQSSLLRNPRGRAFGTVRQIRTTTLDHIIRRLGLPYPDFIKADLQGAELEFLRGASECLRHAQAVVLEVLFIPLYEAAPLAADVFAFMRDRGFRCHDFLLMWHRPLDGALAFADVLFLREEHPLMADHRWGIRPAPWET